jgi:hypothetical protein
MSIPPDDLGARVRVLKGAITSLYTRKLGDIRLTHASFEPLLQELLDVVLKLVERVDEVQGDVQDAQDRLDNIEGELNPEDDADDDD